MGSAEQKSSIWPFFAIFLISLVPAAIAIQPKIQEDTWWHLRVGEMIAETHSVPETDSFSQLGQSRQIRWYAYSWLYELGLFESYKALDLEGLRLTKVFLSALSVTAVGWFFLRNRYRDWRSITIFAVMIPAFVPMLNERPWHFTIVGCVLVLVAIDKIQSGARLSQVWWLFPTFVIWANCHIQFVLGFGIIGCATASTFIGSFRSGRSSLLKSYLLLALGCFLATIINPYHFKIYLIIWEYASQSSALRSIQELQPPDFANWWNWPLIATGMFAVIVLIRRCSLYDCLLFGMGLFFALRMQRDVWFGVLIAMSVLKSNTSSKPTSSASIWSFWLIPGAFVGVYFIIRIGLINVVSLEATLQKSYPVKAIEFLHQRKLDGPMLNQLDWGGYLIWTAREYPVAIDGRTNLYGNDLLEESINAWSMRDGWEQNPGLLKSGFIVAPLKQQGEPVLLTTEILRDRVRWKVIYEDAVAIIAIQRK